MAQPSYSARARDIAPASLTGDVDGQIWFGSGDAYPEILPDMADIAARAARDFRTETLQYAPRGGLPELREWIAGYLASQGARAAVDQILVVNGAKHGIELACKLFLDPGDDAAHALGVDFLPASRFYASPGPRDYLRPATAMRPRRS